MRIHVAIRVLARLGRCGNVRFGKTAARRMSSRHFTPPLTSPDDIPLGPPWHALESRATRWIKRAAACALAAAYFLPLTSCKGKDTFPSTTFPWNDAWQFFVVLLFFWPLLYEALVLVATRLASDFGHPWGRLALVGGSLAGIAWLAYPVLAFDGRLRYGACVAVAALATYGAMLVAVWRRRLRGQPPSG
jgi:hypothetical protein